MNRRHLLLGTAGLGLLAAPGILRAQALPEYTPNAKLCRITTGSDAGNYHWATVSEGGLVPFLGNTFDKVQPLTSRGSRENVDRLLAGQADMGWTQEDVYIDMTKANPGLRRILPVFRRMYVELFQIVAATSNGWSSLAEMAKAGGELGIGMAGSGVGETWRILTELNKDTQKAYEKVSGVPIGAGYNRFVHIRDTRGIAQALIEGPGSDNSKVANEVSGENGKQELRLLDVDDSRWASLKRADGEPLYKTYRLKPVAPVAKSGSKPAQEGFYDKLLPTGGIFSSAGVATQGVWCVVLARAEWLAALDNQTQTRLGRAFGQSLTGIKRKVNPFSIDV